MNVHDATECAYKNGYEKGYEQGVRDMARRLKNYYTSLPLPKTQPAVVEYNIRTLEKELIEKNEQVR